MALFIRDYPGWTSTRKVKPIGILLKQETVSGSGISRATCKSAPHSRQITTPAPNHSVFKHQMPDQQHQSTEGKHKNSTACNYFSANYLLLAILELVRPIPMHFSRCGANLDAARVRWQFGHTHSYCFFIIGGWPNMSRPGVLMISTITAHECTVILDEHQNRQMLYKVRKWLASYNAQRK